MAKIVKNKDFEKKQSSSMGSSASVSRTVSVAPTKGGVVGKKDLAAQGKAEKILADAQNEAKKILEEAQAVLANAEQVREQNSKEGYAKGEAKGLAQVTEQLIKLQELKQTFYDNAEPEVIKLVMSISEKVIGQIVNENPQVVENVVRQGLERSLGDRITIKVNPEDYKTLLAKQVDFKDMLDRSKRLILKEDENIARGGCTIETEVGTLDAQIETQLEAIKKALAVK